MAESRARSRFCSHPQIRVPRTDLFVVGRTLEAHREPVELGLGDPLRDQTCLRHAGVRAHADEELAPKVHVCNQCVKSDEMDLFLN